MPLKTKLKIDTEKNLLMFLNFPVALKTYANVVKPRSHKNNFVHYMITKSWENNSYKAHLIPNISMPSASTVI